MMRGKPLGIALVLLIGCGAPAPEARAPSRAELETCQRERHALQQRVEQLVSEREVSPEVVEIDTPDPPGDERQLPEEIRMKLPRAALESLLADQATLMRSARVVPVSHHGQVTGVRVYGIRAGGPLTQLGIENGDEIRSVNGFELTTPQKMLEAYATLRNASELRIEMLRSQRPLRLVVELVER
jgi:type II secretory pathway component PulC